MSKSDKWVSVKDRLPDEEEDVLILIKETEYYGKHRDRKKIYYWMFVGWHIDGKWATTYCFGYNYLDNAIEELYGTSALEVTHWRPLPHLPKFLKTKKGKCKDDCNDNCTKCWNQPLREGEE